MIIQWLAANVNLWTQWLAANDKDDTSKRFGYYHIIEMVMLTNKTILQWLGNQLSGKAKQKGNMVLKSQ